MPTEKQIQNRLFEILQQRNQHSQKPLFFDVTANCNFFDWESDFIFKDQDSLIYEMEIKTSMADFKADFKKKKKHEQLKRAVSEMNTNRVPSFFYYVVPTGILSESDVPIYAGLYEYRETKNYIDIFSVKPAPRLSNKKADLKDTIKMLRSTSFKYWRARSPKTIIR